MADPVTNWIDARVKVAVDEAMQTWHDELQADLTSVETNLTAQITSLPGLLAGQIGNVVVDAEGIATRVVDKMPPLLQSLLNPAQLVQQIISGVLQGIPNVFNPLKEERP